MGAGRADDGCVDTQVDAGKKILRPGARRRDVDWAMTPKGYRQQRACALAGIDPRVSRRSLMRSEDTDLRARQRICHRKGGGSGIGGGISCGGARDGLSRQRALQSPAGQWVNWKKLYRICKQAGLTVRKRGGRKRALGTRAPMTIPRGRTSAGASTSCPTSVLCSLLPDSEPDRQLQPGMPGDCRRHVVVGHPWCPRVGPDRRNAGLSLHGGL